MNLRSQDHVRIGFGAKIKKNLCEHVARGEESPGLVEVAGISKETNLTRNASQQLREVCYESCVV